MIRMTSLFMFLTVFAFGCKEETPPQQNQQQQFPQQQTFQQPPQGGQQQNIGAQLYGQNCSSAGCHGPLQSSNLRNRGRQYSFQDIKGAFVRITQMQHLNNSFTDQQLQAIAQSIVNGF